jgi:hypothetical protein
VQLGGFGQWGGQCLSAPVRGRLRHFRVPTGARPRARLNAVGTLTGRVHGSTIDLDAVPSAPFEGKRVRVVLELVDDDVRLGAEHGMAWNAWVTHGPDGPIEDDGEPEFP